MDKRKASKVDMKKVSRMKWEPPKLVILTRDLGGVATEFPKPFLQK